MADKITIKDIPFIKNLPGDRHCWQASLGSALGYFKPEKVYTMATLEELTGFEEGKLTWPIKTYLKLAEMGFDTVVYEPMNLHEFVKSPLEYLKKDVGESAAKFYWENSNVPGAVEDAKALLSRPDVKINSQVPTLADLRHLIEKNYRCICMIDQNQLTGEEGHGDHAVLAIDINETHVTVHNSGPPPEAFQKIPLQKFDEVWTYPAESSKALLAIKI